MWLACFYLCPALERLVHGHVTMRFSQDFGPGVESHHSNHIIYSGPGEGT